MSRFIRIFVAQKVPGMRFAIQIILAAMLWLWAAVASATGSVGAGSADAPSDGAAAVADSLEVSLLTCSPGVAVYELYGHTALRVRNVRSGNDVVFNYGIFDFSAPHFVWRFVLGQTDYVLGATDYTLFAALYAADGRGIEEQVLDLRPDEKQRLLASLADTFGKVVREGWTYRYNFLYDNCTTRAIDEIARCVDGRIAWPEAGAGKTFRTVVHEFSAEASPWNRFGQDLLLGAETDAPAGTRQLMFSPVYAARFADSARIVASDGTVRQLVRQRQVLVEASPRSAARFPLSPMAVAGVLLLLAVALSAGGTRWRKAARVFDALLLLVQGLAGCIVALLFFCSEHPAVGSNWLVLLLNPLPLLYLPWKLWREGHGRRSWFAEAALLLLAVCGVAAVVSPQKFPPEIYLLAACLLVRALGELRAGRRRSSES